uniref:Uncharacterized protein n=1 Tax=Tetranychus urticae TaxID=32264 RepID=A0A158P5H8_TETUR
MKFIGSRLPKLVKGIFFGFIGLLLICQIVHLYQQYTLQEVKVETLYHRNSPIEMPNLTFCFKLLHVLDIKLLFEKFPDILSIVKNISVTNKDYTGRSYTDIIVERDEILFDRLTTLQFFDTVKPIEELFKFCLIRTENVPSINCSLNWLRRIHSKNLCLTLRSNATFDYNNIVFDGYGNSPLAFFLIDLTPLPLIKQILVAAHISEELPWFHQISFAELIVNEDTEYGYSLSFHKHVDINLPGSNLNGCNQQLSNNFKDVPSCYEHCLMGQFVDREQKYPRDFLIKSGDDFKLIDNYWVSQSYYNLTSKLYRQCKQVCGLKDCVEINYILNKLKPSQKSQIPGKNIKITILPSKLVTVIKSRKLVITFANYISSVGGLIGLWFGSSFYSLIKLLLHFRSKSLETRKMSKISKKPKRLFHHRKVTPVATIAYKPVNIEHIPRTHYLSRVNLL